MRTLCKVQLIGRVGRVPEIKQLQSGYSVANFTLATDESTKDSNGNWTNEVQWHSVRAIGSVCDKLKNVDKGDLLYIDGRIKYRVVTKEDGTKATYTDIQANQITIFDKRRSEQTAADQEQVTNQPAPAPVQAATEYPQDDNDLPF